MHYCALVFRKRRYRRSFSTFLPSDQCVSTKHKMSTPSLFHFSFNFFPHFGTLPGYSSMDVIIHNTQFFPHLNMPLSPWSSLSPPFMNAHLFHAPLSIFDRSPVLSPFYLHALYTSVSFRCILDLQLGPWRTLFHSSTPQSILFPDTSTISLPPSCMSPPLNYKLNSVTLCHSSPFPKKQAFLLCVSSVTAAPTQIYPHEADIFVVSVPSVTSCAAVALFVVFTHM